MDFQKWLCKEIKSNINGVLSEDVILSLENRYKKEVEKFSERKNHNYIWELLSVHMDPISILKCGQVCWEWYRWSRANITWLSKKNNLVKIFPELISLFDKDCPKNNHNTRMINIEKRDLTRYGRNGCEVFISPKGIWSFYAKTFLPIIKNRRIEFNQLRLSTFVPILMSLYRHDPFYQTLENKEILQILPDWKKKTIIIKHNNVKSEITIKDFYFSDSSKNFVEYVLYKIL
jgi:hypothetical protein